MVLLLPAPDAPGCSVSALFESGQADGLTATIVAGDPLIEADGDRSFTISLSAAAPQGGVSVSYNVGGSATAGADYETLSGSATMPAGATSVTVPVLVNDDPGSEGDEELVVTLAAGSGYQLGVFDDDTFGAGETPAEGGSDGSFVVSLAAPAPSIGPEVGYTVGGTAANGTDYASLNGTLAPFTDRGALSP